MSQAVFQAQEVGLMALQGLLDPVRASGRLGSRGVRTHPKPSSLKPKTLNPKPSHPKPSTQDLKP